MVSTQIIQLSFDVAALHSSGNTQSCVIGCFKIICAVRTMTTRTRESCPVWQSSIRPSCHRDGELEGLRTRTRSPILILGLSFRHL